MLDVANEKPDRTIFIIPLRLDDCTVQLDCRLGSTWIIFHQKISKRFQKRVLESLKIRAKSQNFDRRKLYLDWIRNRGKVDLLLKDAITIATHNEKITYGFYR